jgi:hypothetical protein
MHAFAETGKPETELGTAIAPVDQDESMNLAPDGSAKKGIAPMNH